MVSSPVKTSTPASCRKAALGSDFLHRESSTEVSTSFTLRRIAVSAFGPSLLFGLGEGAILPVIALSARDLGASVPVAALVVTMIGIGSLISKFVAELKTRILFARVLAARWWSSSSRSERSSWRWPAR